MIKSFLGNVKKRIVPLFLAAAFAFSVITPVSAHAENLLISTRKTEIPQEGTNLVLVDGQSQVLVKAGETYMVTQSFKLRSVALFGGSYGEFKVQAAENAPFEIRLKSEQTKLGDDAKVEQVLFYNDGIMTVTYELSVSDYATIGEHKIGISVKYTDNELNELSEDFGTYYIPVYVIEEKTVPTLSLVTTPEINVKAGQIATLKAVFKNVGELDLYDTYATLTEAEAVLTPYDSVFNKKLGIVAAGQTQEVEYKFKVADDAVSNRYKFTIVTSGKDRKGNEAPVASHTVYVNVEGNGQTGVIISDVKQSTSSPKPGNTISVTFNLKNGRTAAISNLKVALSSVSSMGFEPISSDPYIFIGDVPANSTKKITIKVKLGENISEGTNKLDLILSGDGNFEEPVSLYILNVDGNGSSVSKPKLMVTEFGADVENILAGTSFSFTFKIKNTNETTTAKNIKVKVSGDVFSVTSGSNSFFVNEIKPGQEKELTINLKASNTATTGTYTISISTEYEYEGMPKSDTGSGVSSVDELLIQVNEALRASLENIVLDTFQNPSVGQKTALTFEFYNMGKSTLNNVYVTVEGDFELATGNSYYIGNIMPGSPEFVECTVTPLKEGESECKLIVHMEDSNGNEVTRETSSVFTIGSGSGFDPGFIDPGFDPGIIDPGFNPGNIDKPEDNKPKGIAGFFKNIKPWMYVVVVVLVAGIVVTVVAIVKTKKKNREFEDFDD